MAELLALEAPISFMPATWPSNEPITEEREAKPSLEVIEEPPKLSYSA